MAEWLQCDKDLSGYEKLNDQEIIDQVMNSNAQDDDGDDNSDDCTLLFQQHPMTQ